MGCGGGGCETRKAHKNAARGSGETLWRERGCEWNNPPWGTLKVLGLAWKCGACLHQAPCSAWSLLLPLPLPLPQLVPAASLTHIEIRQMKKRKRRRRRRKKERTVRTPKVMYTFHAIHLKILMAFWAGIRKHSSFRSYRISTDPKEPEQSRNGQSRRLAHPDFKTCY